MTLQEWAARWGVPWQAIQELAAVNTGAVVEPSRPITSESALQSLVRLEAGRKHIHLWRNNVGVLLDKTGRPVRYGLANESAALNEVVKSADLIGIEKVLIKPDDVGKIIGRFVSRECKRPDWVFTGKPEELAQLQWATTINAYGGNAAIVNSEGTL